jgi:hypothetical protein
VKLAFRLSIFPVVVTAAALFSGSTSAQPAKKIQIDPDSQGVRVEYNNEEPPTDPEAACTRQLNDLRHQLFTLEKAGRNNIPAHQILTEAEWLPSSTRDYSRLANRLAAVDEQSEADGSWGRWYTEWFLKLNASYARIDALRARGEQPKYPLRFLDRINSPEKLTAHLNRLLISNPEVDGIKHRHELNETISALIRLIVRDPPTNYSFHPRLKAALLDFLERARNPKTGYWCAWYWTAAQPRRVDDLSLTFHIVSYLKGGISDWPKVLDTTLAIKDKTYPAGWLSSGHYLNHNNMDVVELFRLGWKQASPPQRDAMRVEIRKMLAWCLHDSLQPDGSFRVFEDEDDSVETSIYFATAFLGRIGYFNKSRRFWTDEDFPDSAAVKKSISGFIRAHFASGGEGGHYYHGALEELGETDPR